jgi:hypothetical protein
MLSRLQRRAVTPQCAARVAAPRPPALCTSHHQKRRCRVASPAHAPQAQHDHWRAWPHRWRCAAEPREHAQCRATRCGRRLERHACRCLAATARRSTCKHLQAHSHKASNAVKQSGRWTRHASLRPTLCALHIHRPCPPPSPSAAAPPTRPAAAATTTTAGPGPPRSAAASTLT